MRYSVLLIVGLVCFVNRTFSTGFNCEVIKYHQQCEIVNDKLTVIDSVILQINNRTGELYSEIELFYEKESPVENLSAWIEDSRGHLIRHLRKQEITEANAFASFSFYEDRYVKSFVLKHNQYPYRICYTYRKTSRQFLSISHWFPVVDTDIPTREALLTLKYPVTYPVNIKAARIDSPLTFTDGQTRTTIWKTRYDGSYKKEVFSPEPEDLLPFVHIVPVNFLYGIPGSMQTWQSYGNWQYRLLEGLNDLPPLEINKVKSLIQDIPDKHEKIKALYHYLQDNIRYINVSIDIGGLKPYPASYVSVNKYGDCKALTNYMKALLEVANIPSFYTKVYAEARSGEIEKDFPSQQFNHVVLTVPIDGDTIWLENTNKSNPFGYTGTFIQNRYALLVEKENSRLIRTPVLQLRDVTDGRRIDFSLQKSGETGLLLRYSLRGPSFEAYNDLLTDYNTDVINKVMHNVLPFADYHLEAWELHKPGRDSGFVTLISKLKVKNLLEVIEEDYYFSFLPADLPYFAPPKTRRLPVYIPYPVSSHDTLVYHLPDGISSIDLPEPTSISGKYGWYRILFKTEGNRVIVLRNVCINRGYYAPEEYPEFYGFYNAIKTDEKRKILIH
ncbi:MAG: DUF3857 domain-containing protein [Bacteroidales bacterium]|nr:DUF3857 domain-containing protein [Bacteroidales bacterium]